jgi:hypothetical protein
MPESRLGGRPHYLEDNDRSAVSLLRSHRLASDSVSPVNGVRQSRHIAAIDEGGCPCLAAFGASLAGGIDRGGGNFAVAERTGDP